MNGYAACGECGTVLSMAQRDGHACNPQQRIAHQVATFRDRLEDATAELAAHLQTPLGRFDLYCARRPRGSS